MCVCVCVLQIRIMNLVSTLIFLWPSLHPEPNQNFSFGHSVLQCGRLEFEYTSPRPTSHLTHSPKNYTNSPPPSGNITPLAHKYTNKYVLNTCTHNVTFKYEATPPWFLTRINI